MAEELKARIIRSSDEQRYDQASGRVRKITRVEYMLGELGPFVHECPREECTEYQLEAAFEERRRALARFV